MTDISVQELLKTNLPVGATGISGSSGASGFSGISGYSGASGYSGISGFSGITGATGPSANTEVYDEGILLTNSVSSFNFAGAGVVATNESGAVTVTIAGGGWTGVVPIEFTYQWQRVTTNIVGATSKTYVPVSADQGNTLRCVVTATSAGGTASVTTANTAVVSGIVPSNTVLPVITGTARVAEVQTVSEGTWAGTTPLTFTYQWQRGTIDISGATSNTYTADFADQGNTLRCVVTATNAAGTDSVTTANTGTILAPVVGGAIAGGFYAGQISTTADSVATHYLIVGPRRRQHSNGKTQIQPSPVRTALLTGHKIQRIWSLTEALRSTLPLTSVTTCL